MWHDQGTVGGTDIRTGPCFSLDRDDGKMGLSPHKLERYDQEDPGEGRAGKEKSDRNQNIIKLKSLQYEGSRGAGVFTRTQVGQGRQQVGDPQPNDLVAERGPLPASGLHSILGSWAAPLLSLVYRIFGLGPLE